MTDQIFGKRLKDIRMQKGLTQKELADRLFVSRRCIGNWEAGRRKPDIVAIPMIADALNVDANYFFEHDRLSAPLPNVIIFNNESSIISPDTKLIKKALSATNPNIFDKAEDVLSYARSNMVSVAFLDLDNNSSDCLFLAKELISINKKINIIFISGTSQYTLMALGLFCSGYMVKPLSQKKIIEQVEHLRFPVDNILQNKGK
ncbi:MAG: helix-turn-helix domain-containing protein [Butyrivibrio sp.]|nr:helix-turn-helix domain-containing protein [Butyrivibrio sp.]